MDNSSEAFLSTVADDWLAQREVQVFLASAKYSKHKNALDLFRLVLECTLLNTNYAPETEIDELSILQLIEKFDECQDHLATDHDTPDISDNEWAKISQLKKQCEKY